MTNEEYLKYVVGELSKPIPYKWKLQGYNKAKTKAMCVAYIDARLVTNKLNEVCTYGWHRQHQVLNNDVYCSVGLVMPDASIQWRSDAGESDNDFEKTKTAASDSFKRAAKEFGIGLFLYDLDIINLPVKQDGNYYNVVKPNGEKVWDLTKYINEEYLPAQTAANKAPQATQTAKATKATPAKEKAAETQPKQAEAAKPTKAETKQADPKAKLADKDGNLQPNTAAVESTPDAERKEKAKAYFKKLTDEATALKFLIKEKGIRSFAKVGDFVDGTDTEEVLKVYKELREYLGK